MPAPSILRQKPPPTIHTRKRGDVMRRLMARHRRQPLSTAAAVTVTQPHYRRAADTYAEAPDGTVQIWNGIDKPLRFDPAVGTTENVGVKAPTDVPNLGGNGSGAIVGTFQAYVRFVDRSGNTSSFSPVSNTFTPSTSVGTITNATYDAPIVVTTSAAHNLSSGQIVKIVDVLGNDAANGTWTAKVLSSTTFSLYTGGGVPSLGNGSYIAGGTVTTGVSQLVYSNVAISTESKVTRRQLLRNKDGDTSVFYVDIDTTDLTSTTFSSSQTDDSLVTDVSLFDVNGETLVDHSVPITSKKLVANYLGRMFASGNEPYSEGAVLVTNGSATVTGIGTEWGQLTFPGRYLQVQGGDKLYTIQSVESKTSLTLSKVYGGSTDQFAYYTISNGPAERRTIYFTQVSQPEAWPATFLLPLAEDPNAGEISALIPIMNWLVIGFDNRLFRFSFVDDPLTDGSVVPAGNRGVVNNHSWAKLDGMVYCMDTLGFYLFDGNDVIDISSPAVRDLFRNRQSGPYKLNWKAKRTFHAVYDPTEYTLRWFVCMGSSTIPYHAVVYNIPLKRWWIEEYPFPIGASCAGRMNGRQQVFLGTDAKRIMALHTSLLDGVDPGSGTVRGTVTSAGIDWFKDTAASFPSSLAGQEVQITAGAGKGQRRRIVSQSGSQINVNYPWTTGLDTTTGYQIGGVTYKWRSAWLSFDEGRNAKERAVTVTFTPTGSASEMHLRIYQDKSATATSWSGTASAADGNGIAVLSGDPATDLAIDSTKSVGFVRHRYSGTREFATDGTRYVSAEIGGVTNADQINVLAVGFDEIEQE